MIYLIKPTTQEGLNSLRNNIGRDSWRYGGEVEQGRVAHTVKGGVPVEETTRIIEVYFFDFNKILDADVQQHMIRSRAKVHNMTLTAAERYLRRNGIAVECNSVELEPISTEIPFVGQEMKCCMCGKTQMSDPNIESNWTFIEMDGFSAYCCPACLQDSEQAKNGNYDVAYERVMRRVIRLRKRHLRGLNN